MGTVEVVNKYTYSGKGINIMRGTPLGNQFTIEESGSREMAVLKYYKWFRKEFAKKTEVHNIIMDIVSKVQSGEEIKLICCCKPKLCHGDIIKVAIESIIEKSFKKT